MRVRKTRVGESVAKGEKRLNAKLVVSTVADGESLAEVRNKTRSGVLLGVSLANLVNIFNPECLVLSGPDTDASILAGDLLLDPMYQALKQHLFSQIGKDMQIKVERLGFESWARGAGNLVLRHFFASPASVHSDRTLTEG